MRHCLALCGAAALFLSPVLGNRFRPGAAATAATSGRAGRRPGWSRRHTANSRGGAGRQQDLPPHRHLATQMVAPSSGPLARRACGCLAAVAAATVDSANIPFQPWAKAVYADRLENQLEPHTRCKPSVAFVSS
jgi:hypothetical protein